MAVERPIYSTETDEPIKPLSLRNALGCSIAAGVIFGIGTNFIWGPEVGMKVGLSISSFMSGVTFNLVSSDRAEMFAQTGEKKRAYVEALLATFEAIAGLSVALGIAGSAFGEAGAIAGGVTGVFIGFGGGQLPFSRVSEALGAKSNPSSKS